MNAGMKTSAARNWLMLSSVLVLAACANHPAAPVIERGGVPAGGSAPVAATAANTAAVAPAPLSPEVAAGVANGSIHLVKKGDTLYSIGRERGQNPKDLILWNNLSDPNKLETDQPIRLTPPDGVIVKPIAAVAPVETRPLGPVPVVVVPATSAPAKTPANSETFKREPKAGKQAYSDEAWAQAQKGEKGEKPVVQAVTKPAAATTVATAEAAKPTEAKAGDTLEWGWPAGGKILKPYSAGGNKGVDIDGKVGDPVVAAAAGKVIYAGNYPHYGKLLIVKHNGALLTAYAHNNQILVKEGQTVAKGQKIAELGKTDSDVPKLHFEVRSKGTSIDPMKYLPSRE